MCYVFLCLLGYFISCMTNGRLVTDIVIIFTFIDYNIKFRIKIHASIHHLWSKKQNKIQDTVQSSCIQRHKLEIKMPFVGVVGIVCAREEVCWGAASPAQPSSSLLKKTNEEACRQTCFILTSCCGPWQSSVQSMSVKYSHNVTWCLLVVYLHKMSVYKEHSRNTQHLY